MFNQENRGFVSKVGEMLNFTSGLSNPASWLMELFGSNKASTGVFVNTQTALSVPEVYNAVSKISGHIASMPLECWEETSPGEKAKIQEPGCTVWNRPGMWTRAELVEKLMVDALLLGNGRLYIGRDGNNQVRGLYPLQSDTARTIMVDGKRWHLVPMDTTVDAGIPSDAFEQQDTPSGAVYAIPDKDVFYVMGLTVNGFWGENLLSLAKDTIGLSVTGNESAGTLYLNSGKPGILLKAPKGTFRSAEDASEFLTNFRKATGGVENAGKTAMIKDGMEVVNMQWQTMDSSHVDMRQFQRESAALLFLLESVIGTDAGSAYKGVTEKNTAYLVNCLLRWMNKIQCEADRKLLSARSLDRKSCYTKLSLSPLYQNDRAGLALYTSSLRQQGIISTDEARDLHGYKKAEDVDEKDFSTDYDSLIVPMSGSSADPTQEQQADPNEAIEKDEPGPVEGD